VPVLLKEATDGCNPDFEERSSVQRAVGVSAGGSTGLEEDERRLFKTGFGESHSLRPD